jgi:aryl-alcohol dehydrogenase-like predicted oxidoreductase
MSPTSPPELPPQNESVSWPRLGLGCVTFGREIDRADSFAMMDHALHHRITLFDTAAAYGSGASEEIVGQWLAARGTRERLILATKILPPYSAAAIETAVSVSLRRLAQPSVDLLYLHRWEDSVLEPEVLRALDGLVRDGRVRQLAASNFSTVQLEQAVRRQADLGVAQFRALQTVHNYAVRSVDEPMRSVCARERIAIIGYSPLGAGFLTGKHAQGVQRGSRFDLIPGHQNVYFNALAHGRLARLEQVASQSGVAVTRLALAWALQQPQIATVLVGGRTTAHLDQALHALAFSAPNLMQELDDN